MSPAKHTSTREMYVLTGTGEGASCEVVSDLREGLHKFMCACGKTLEGCDEKENSEVATLLEEMESKDNWSFDESGRKFQYGFEGYCYGITFTVLYAPLPDHHTSAMTASRNSNLTMSRFFMAFLQVQEFLPYGLGPVNACSQRCRHSFLFAVRECRVRDEQPPDPPRRHSRKSRAI